MSSVIVAGLFFMVPGNVEMFVMGAQAMSNLGLYGVYMDIKNNRDILYIMGISCTIAQFVKLPLWQRYAIYTFAFVSLGRYINTIHRWRYIT
jgi:hypothetical protein